MLSADVIVPEWSESSKKQFNSRLNGWRTILQNIGLDIENPETYKVLTITQISELLDNTGKKPSTQESYVSTLCSLFTHFNGDVQTYKQLLEYQKQLNSVPSEVKPFNDEEYIQYIEKITNETDDMNMQIIGKLSLCNELTGIRMDDLVSTMLVESDEYSWIDCENKVWYIKNKYTKNGKDRSFPVPDSFITVVNSLKPRVWLLCNKQGRPYKNGRFMLQKFRMVFGFNYGKLRKTAVQRVSDNNQLQDNKEKSNVLGHRLETSIKKYTQSNKKMYIMRGLPGSGKSTSAQKLNGVVLSTDDFWVDDKGTYVFNQNMLNKAHKWNQDRCLAECNRGTPIIVIDNTNCTPSEYSIYEKYAKQFDYNIIIREPRTEWKYDPDECYRKCTHGVPLHAIKLMKSKWVDVPQTKLKPLIKKKY